MRKRLADFEGIMLCMGRQKSFQTFIAIPVSDQSRSEIANFQLLLARHAPQVDWQPPTKFFIPLHSLGRTDASFVHKIASDLKTSLAGYPPFSLTPSHLEYFYKKHGQSTLYMALSEKESLKSFELTLRELLHLHGFSLPHRFTPQIPIGTLFIPRDSNQVKQILYSLLAIPHLPFSPFVANSLSILETHSWQAQDKFDYRLLASIPFGL